eukprot:scaffold76921_cov63-Phaeocystis_antarctica.AAC.3
MTFTASPTSIERSSSHRASTFVSSAIALPYVASRQGFGGMCAATIGGAGRTKQERAPSDFGFVTIPTDFLRAVYAELGGEGGPSETAFAVKAIFPREYIDRA